MYGPSAPSGHPFPQYAAPTAYGTQSPFGLPAPYSGPTVPARRGSTAGAVAVVLWVLTGASLAWLAFCALNIAFWAVIAGGNPLGHFALPGGCLVAVIGAVAALNAYLTARGIPRTSRLVALGAVALPVPLVGALWTIVWLGTV